LAPNAALLGPYSTFTIRPFNDGEIAQAMAGLAITGKDDVDQKSTHSKAGRRQQKQQDASKLIIGACYSLKTVLSRLSPVHVDQSAPLPAARFSFDAGDYHLHYYETGTGWRFVAMEEAGRGNAAISVLDTLADYYGRVFVSETILSPFTRYQGREIIGRLDERVGLVKRTEEFFTSKV
jgi:hypothetical protein